MTRRPQPFSIIFLLAFLFTPVKSAEADPSPYERLKSGFDERLSAITAEESKRVEDVSAAYFPRVRQELEKYKAQGDLDAVQRISEEIARVEAGELTLESVDENPLPELDSLRKILAGSFREARDRRLEAERTLIGIYIAALEDLKVELVKDDRVEEALAASKEIERHQTYLAGLERREDAAPGGGEAFPAELERGLVLRYTFENVDEERIVNQASGRWHATASGAERIPQGKFGHGIEFTGDTSRLAIDDELPDADRFTFSAWIDLAEPGEDAGIFSDYDQAGARDTFFSIVGESGVFVRADKDGATLHSSAPLANSLRRGWNHLVWVMDRRSSKIYLNGDLSAEVEQEGSNEGNHNAFIGHAHNGSRYLGMQGKMDEACLWRRSLSEEEVKALYEFNP